MKTKMALALILLTACSAAIAQTWRPISVVPLAENEAAQSGHEPDKSTTTLDAQRERQALRICLKIVQETIVSAAEAMPATKYEFTPTEGEFKGVRTFALQVRPLAATNHILAAAALGEEPPADAGNETGPETVRTKAEILDYLNSSFARLGPAIATICQPTSTLTASPTP